MKTPDEYLDEFSTDTTTKGRVKAEDAIKAIRAAVKDACKEQREICAQAYEHSSTFVNQYNSVTKNDVKNAPEPTMI